MQTNVSYVLGVDCSAESFTATLRLDPKNHAEGDQSTQGFGTREFSNSTDGVDALLEVLAALPVALDSVLFAVENTGVYSATLCHRLSQQGHRVSLIAPQHIKKASSPGAKTDAIDAARVCEYAWRYSDQLKLWQPRQELTEQLSTLLITRDQLVKTKTSHSNILSALKRHPVRTRAAEKIHATLVRSVEKQIRDVEREIQRLIDSDKDLSRGVRLLRSVPGIGLMAAATLAAMSDCFTVELRYRSLAAHLGIVPQAHTSRTSVRGPARCRGFGPLRLRLLLRLAAWSQKKNNPEIRGYFECKKAEGKASTLIFNNIANKILRRAIGTINSGQPYSPVLLGETIAAA